MEHFICNKCGNVVFKDDSKCMNCSNDMESIITYSVNQEISKYDSNYKWSLSFALISFFSTFFCLGVLYLYFLKLV